MDGKRAGRAQEARRRHRRPADVPLADRGGHLVGLAAVRGGQPDRPGRPGPRSPLTGRGGHLGAGHRRGLRHRAAAQDRCGQLRGDGGEPAPRSPRRLGQGDQGRPGRPAPRALPGRAGPGEDRLRLGGALLPAPQARRGNQGAPAGREGHGRPSLGTFGLGSGYGSGRRDPGFGSPPGAGAPSSAEADAERIVGVLSEYATAARAEEVWAGGTVEIAGARSGPATGPGSNRPGTLPQIPASRAGSSR